MTARVLAGAALALLLGSPAAAQPPREVRVFAASSLGDAFRALAAELQAAGGPRVELNLAGTPALRAQIEQGAAADVYAFADLQHASALQARGLARPHRVFARNLPCVAVPAGAPRVRTLADLARPGTKVVMAAPNVPAGHYADVVLRKLEEVDGLGRGYRSRVLANVVSQEPNVRLVLAKVALGEADAGFVYATDAAGNARVGVIPIPAAANVEAEYAIGLLRVDASAAARAFVDEVMGERGQRTLRAHGFRPRP
jgi:molybdate transport system substrate-binding protein